MNYSCSIQTSWYFTPGDPIGIAYDNRSQTLLIVSSVDDKLYNYTTTGVQQGSWDPSGTSSEGVALEWVYVAPPDTTAPSLIEEIMKRIGEKLPEAAKSLVPLIVAVVLIIIYVFVI